MVRRSSLIIATSAASCSILRRARDQAVMLDLIDGADVLLDNFRPAVLPKLGLAPEVLRERNPRLIQCSITGYGSAGPYRDRPAFDGVGRGSQRNRKPVRRSATAGGVRTDHLRQCHRHAGVLRDPGGLGGARPHRPRTADRNQHAGGDHGLCAGRLHQFHPRRHRFGPAFQSRDLAVFHLPLRRRRPHRHPSVDARKILARTGRGAGSARTRRRRALRHPSQACRSLPRPARRAGEALLDQAAPGMAATARRRPTCRRHRSGTWPRRSTTRRCKRSARSVRHSHPSEGIIRSVHCPVLVDGARPRSDMAPPPLLGEHSQEILAEIAQDRARRTG